MSETNDSKGSWTLAGRAAKWAREMRNAATGPLVIAAEVCEVADHWEVVEAEACADMGAEKVAATAYLKWKLGQGLGFWLRRADAVRRLGEACRRTIHHDAAKWIVANVPDDKIDAVKFAAMRACRENNGIPVTEKRVRLLAAKMLGTTAKPETVAPCERCRHLEEVLRQHGLSV